MQQTSFIFLMLNIVQSKGHDLIRDAIRTKKRKWGAGHLGPVKRGSSYDEKLLLELTQD